MSKPNRKAVRLGEMRAQRAEAAKVQFVDLYFDNADGAEECVTFPTQDQWPVEIVEQVNENTNGNVAANMAALRELASPPEAFDRLVKVAKLTIGELNDLIDAMDEEAGTTPGEGDGSSESSNSTPEPSAPTSSATTPAAV